MVVGAAAAVSASASCGCCFRLAASAGRPAAEMPDWGRRRFLGARSRSAPSRWGAAWSDEHCWTRADAPPAAGRRAPGPAADRCRLRPIGVALDVGGISPIVVPNDRLLPDRHRAPRPARRRRRVAAARQRAWSTSESTLTYDDLLAMPLFEQYVTIACVSNEVGGELVGNALWTRRAAARRPRRWPASRPAPPRSSAAPSTASPSGFPTRGDRPGRDADGRHRHERRAAPARARLPGAADRPGPVRLRQRHEVADRDRAHHAGRRSTPTGCRSAGRRRGRS